MDQETRLVLERQGGYITTLTVQLTLLSCMVEALISTHPAPSSARAVFDQLWGQFQASASWASASPENCDLARAMIEKMFSGNR